MVYVVDGIQENWTLFNNETQYKVPKLSSKWVQFHRVINGLTS